MKKYTAVSTGSTEEFGVLARALEESDYTTMWEWINAERKNSVILYTGVLNDDELFQLADGKTYLLLTWHYANSWANTDHHHLFDSLDEALEYYKENYAERVEAEGKRSIEEWQESGEDMSWANPLDEWEDLVYTCLAC